MMYMLQQFNKIRFEKKILLISFIFLLILPQIVLAQTTVQNSPSADDAGWDYASEAYTDGAPEANTTSFNTPGDWYNYGFSIPADSTIDAVWVRDDSWTASAENEGIGIQVSYDGGNTWTTELIHATTTGEQTYWTDVIVAGLTNENLSDSNFRVRVTSRKTGGAPAWWKLDWLPVNVTYTAANQPPTWSNNQSSIPGTYDPAFLAEFNITWQDSETSPDVVFIEQNWTSPASNLTMTNDTYGGSIYNYSVILPAGTYYWKSYANDTQGAWGSSDMWYFTINQADNAADLYFNNGTEYKNDNITITYGTQTNVTGIIQYTNGNLYRNDSDANSENNMFITLPAGTWEYTVNTSGNQNYSANSTTYFIFVNKANTPITLYNNISWTGTYPSSSNTTGENCPSQLLCKLYRNDSGEVSNPDEVLLGAGAYNYTFNTTGNENYTANSTSNILTISQNQTNPINLYFRNSTAEYQNQNMTVTYDEQTNTTTFLVYSNSGTVNLYRNDSDANSENNMFITLPAGTWKYTANTTGNDNYTANTTTFFIFINKGSITVDLYLNGTQNDNKTYTYPEAVNATGTATGGIVYLYRNEVEVKSGSSPQIEEILLGNNTYAYKVNATGNENYSDNSSGVTYYALVNKGTPDVKTFIDDAPSNKTVSYPTSVTIKGNSTTTITPPTFDLYLEDIPLGSGNPASQSITQGNGTYNVIYNTSGNGNWTSASNSTLYLLVNKGDPSSYMNLYIDGVADNETIYYPDSANVSANETTNGDSDVVYTLWRNDTQLISGSDVWNQTQLGNGTYTFVYNTSGGSNWTSGESTTYYLFVNKGDVNISLWLNGTENNKTYTQNQIANFTALINVTGLTINLTSNYTGWMDIQNETVIYNETTLTNIGNFWNLTAFYPESENYSAFSRTYFFNVTTDQPPTWSSNNTDPLSPTSYTPGKSYQFNITCQDDYGVSEVILEFNGTNYSKLLGEISQDGDIYYKTLTDLSANEAGYNYKWYANDTIEQWSSTGSYWLYIVNKNDSQNYMNLTINGTESNKEYTYPAGSNATGWHSIPQLTFNLYRNDTPLGNDNPVSDLNQFAVVFYVYTYNTSGNDNYTTSSKNYNLTIQKNTTNPVRLFLNDNEDNLTVKHPTSTNATGIMVYSDSGTADLFRNDSDANSENNTFITLAASVYEYRVNTTGNDNYTENSTGVVYYLTVSKGPTKMSLWLNNTPDNYTYYQNDWANFTAQLNVSGKTIKLNSSYPGWSEISNDTVIYNITQLNILGNDYNLTAYWDGDENYSSNSQTYFFDVVTNQPPTWSNNQSSIPSNYDPAFLSEFNISWEDSETSPDIVFIEQNWTNPSGENLTMSNDTYQGSIYNYSVILPGGTYYWKSFANDTQGAWGSSDTWYFTINPADNAADLYFNNGTEYKNDNMTVTYGTQTNTTGIVQYTSGNLYRNDSDANSENNTFITLPAGTWEYTVNTSGNQNYSANSTTYYLFVNKGDVNISLWLNGTENNKTYTQNQLANFTALINVTGLTINLTSNYTGWMDIQNETVIYNETTLTNIGNFWNLTAFYPESENYSAFSRTYFFNVTTDEPPTWSSNNTDPLSPTSYTPGKSYQFNITCQDDYGVSEVILEFDGTNYSKLLGEISQDGDVYYKTLTDLSANEAGYNYKWFANDTANQWSSTGSYWLYIVNKNDSQNYMNLTINGTESNKNYIYPAGSNATGWHSIPQLTFNLYRNDTPLGNDNPVSDLNQFAVVFYVYTYNTSGNDNYTTSSKNYNLTIQKNTTNPVRLFLNDNEDNLTVKHPTSTNATGIMVYSDSGTADLFRNDSSVGNPEIKTLGANVYEYRVNTSGNDNYTENSTGVVYYLTVSKGPTKMSLWLNDTPDNYTYYQNEWANFTAQLNVSGKTIKLNSSYPGWSEISNDTVIYNTTQLNTLGNDYNLTAYWGGDGNYSAFSITYFFDVVTNQPPQWSANYTSVPNGTEYTSGRNYGFQINWVDPETSVSVVIFEFNGTNYTDVSNSGETYWYNLTDLPAGTWNYTWYANDTQDTWGQSDRWNYTVTKVTSNAYLTILPSSPITYGTQSIATCTEDNQEGDGNLYRNDSLANSENNTYITLPAETWEYICNVTSTQNYTSATNSSIYIVQKADSTTNMHIAINGSETDQIRQYPNSTNITAWETNINDNDCSYNFYRNDSSTSNPELLELGVGNYTYTYNTTECANYSSGSVTRILNITKGSSILTLSNNLSWSGAYPSASNTSGSGCPSPLTCKLYRNDTGEVSNPDEVLLLPAAYNYTFNTTGNDNYSSNSTSNVLIISKGTVNISLWLNDSEKSKTYDIYDIANFTAQSNVSGLTVNISMNMTGWEEPSDITTVYNTTNLTESGLFNITGYTQGNENYSESSRTYYATVLGAYLEMELIEPTGTKLVREGESFLLNASITCRAANCGDINITPRYGENVIGTTGDLYVNESLRNCTLNKNEGCFANWTVHTTTVGTWNIDVNASNSVNNETSDATLSVYRVVTEVVPLLLPLMMGGFPPSPLLDLEITDLTPVVFTGEDLAYTINLTNVGYNETSFDVVIHKRVIKDNKILLEDAITRSMISGLLITDSIRIPQDFEVGKYFFELYIEYVGKNASALVTFDVKKSCVILSDASYDLSRKMFVLYTESLRNVILRFKNDCEIELAEGILWLDGNKIEIGKIPKEGFDITINFDKYGSHNATIIYKDGQSEIEFYLEMIILGLDINTIITIISVIILILIIVLIKKYSYKFKEILLRPKKVEEEKLEVFKQKLKKEIIKRLKKIIKKLKKKFGEGKEELEVFKQKLKKEIIKRLKKKVEESEEE